MQPFVLVLAVAMAWRLPAAAQADPCPLAKSDAADVAVGDIRTWHDLARYRRDYAACDDGGTAEASSSVVVHLLATQWNTLPALQRALHADPALRPFFLRHVNATANDADLQAVRTLARSQCPAGLDGLCHAIAREAAETAE